MAIHDSIIVVSWNDSHGGHIGKPSHDVGTAVSFDAGATFNSRGFLPRSPSGYVSGGDSRIVATPGGRFLLATLTSTRSGGQQAGLDLYSLDPPTYAAWQLVAHVVAQREVVDKPALAIGSDGTLAIVFMVDHEIVVSMSRNEGRDWSPPLRVSSATKQNRWAEGVRVCGSDVVAAWMENGIGIVAQRNLDRRVGGFRTVVCGGEHLLLADASGETTDRIFARPRNAVGIHSERCRSDLRPFGMAQENRASHHARRRPGVGRPWSGRARVSGYE